MSRSRSRSWDKRRRSSVHSDIRSTSPVDFYSLPDPHCHLLKQRPNSTFTPNLQFTQSVPVPNDQLGDHTLMNQTKSKIDPYYDTWDKIKFLLNPYELIDIYRNPEVA